MALWNWFNSRMTYQGSGKTKTLFKASDANWVESLTEAEPNDMFMAM